jgi:hypothetical protein
VIVLDENIIASQRELLKSWKVHFRAVEEGIGRAGMLDREEIIPLLHSLRRLTFFLPARKIISVSPSNPCCPLCFANDASNTIPDKEIHSPPHRVWYLLSLNFCLGKHFGDRLVD